MVRMAKEGERWYCSMVLKRSERRHPGHRRPQQGAGDGRHLWWRTLWRE
ncbi:hypothetical protein ACNKHM_25655 [Shigella sonnei]